MRRLRYREGNLPKVTELVAELEFHALNHSMPLEGGMPSHTTENNLVLIPATILRLECV